jgi:hypothetical protein
MPRNGYDKQTERSPRLLTTNNTPRRRVRNPRPLARNQAFLRVLHPRLQPICTPISAQICTPASTEILQSLSHMTGPSLHLAHFMTTTPRGIEV